jgi:hypothetical protein
MLSLETLLSDIPKMVMIIRFLGRVLELQEVFLDARPVLESMLEPFKIKSYNLYLYKSFHLCPMIAHDPK